MSRSRVEIDQYKEEMAKNEDYMKKALMRGVCALNMEAMSIFNETIGNKTNIQTNSTNSIEHIDEPKQSNNNNNNKSHVVYCPPSVIEANPLTEPSQSSINKRENDELARKVKHFCEKNLTSKSISAVSKAKWHLLNSNKQPIEESNKEEERPANANGVIGRVYGELSDHYLPATTVFIYIYMYLLCHFWSF